MGKLLDDAIQFAVKAHAGVNRKGKKRPYILHPLEAMLIASGLTEDEEVLAAAVLHDTVEDTPVTREDIERSFGKRVADLVAAESENKRPELAASDTWEIRKSETIAHLKTASREAKLICLGDKLSNIREMARDYAVLGDALWQRFSVKDKSKHAWYYRSVCDELDEEFKDARPIREYRALLEEVFGEKGDICG